MQPIVPPVFRTGNPAIDRNLDAIADAFRRLNLVATSAVASADDHKVIARNTDATTPGGLSEKTIAGPYAALEVVTDGGVEKLRISGAAPPTVPVASTTLPQPLGVATLGDEGKWADGKHVHPSLPTPQITSVYYLDPAPLQPLLVNPCPSTVGALELAFPTTSDPDTPPTSADAITLEGRPGLADWPGGLVNLIVRANVRNMVGTTHQVAVDLYRRPDGLGPAVRYCSVNSPPWVGPVDQYLTGDVQVFRFQVPVKFLSGDVSDLMGLTIYALPGQGGSVDTEILSTLPPWPGKA